MDPQFLELIRAGNLAEVTQALDANPEWLDLPDADGRTPFHHACWRGHLEIVELLFSRGTQAVSKPDRYGSMPIHFGCQLGRLEIVQRLIQAISPNELLHPGATNKTPFEFALEARNHLLLLTLIQAQPEVLFLEHFESLIVPRWSELISAGIQFLPPNRRIDLITDRDYRNLVGAILADSELVDQFLTLVPDCLQQLSPSRICSLITRLIANRRSSSMIERLYEILPIDTPKFKSILIASIEAPYGVERFQWVVKQPELHLLKSKDIMEAVFRSVEIGFVVAFDFLFQWGQNRFGLEWSQEVLMGTFYFASKENSLIEIWKRSCSDRIWNRIAPMYSQLAMDPFCRGRLYAQLFRDDTILHFLAQESIDDIEMMSSAISLLNIVNPPSGGWLAMQTFDHSGNLPLHYAIASDQFNLMEFLIWLGCDLVDTQESVPRSCWTLAGKYSFSRKILSAIRPLADDFETNENRSKIRNRIYFSRSLTHRLLHFI